MNARVHEMTAYAPRALVATDPERLVGAHLGLVRRIAWHVHGRVSTAIPVEDLVQIGMVALIESARAFEDRGSAAFSTYASVRIRGAMIDNLCKSATLVRSAIRRRREYGLVSSRLSGQLGRPPTDAEMAAALEISVEAYRTAADANHALRYESLDEVYSDHSEWFADDAPDAFDNLARNDLRRAVTAAIGDLPEREALVLQLYYVEELNLEEIGLTMNVGAARICQIKKSALDKVRSKLAGWDGD